MHNEYGTVLEVNNNGSNRHLWYSAELPLPYNLGSIDNPIFAVYPGGHWDNETFQKIAVSTDALSPYDHIAHSMTLVHRKRIPPRLASVGIHAAYTPHSMSQVGTAMPAKDCRAL